jgi:hypothetical protein
MKSIAPCCFSLVQYSYSLTCIAWIALRTHCYE